MDDIHAFTLASGVYSEGSRKALSVMVKDSKTYMATGGWGFQLWAAGDAAKHDYVFSTYIP